LDRYKGSSSHKAGSTSVLTGVTNPGVYMMCDCRS
jgi:hypothetical protein